MNVLSDFPAYMNKGQIISCIVHILFIVVIFFLPFSKFFLFFKKLNEKTREKKSMKNGIIKTKRKDKNAIENLYKRERKRLTIR